MEALKEEVEVVQNFAVATVEEKVVLKKKLPFLSKVLEAHLWSSSKVNLVRDLFAPKRALLTKLEVKVDAMGLG